MTRRVAIAALACASLCASCGARQEPGERPKFNCPNKLSKALAFSHLKEAHVSLETMTLDAAEQAIFLTTDGLSCAPPKGNARAATVARLLVVRAHASATLDDNEAALADLQAAIQWADQGKKDDPLLVPEIHLTLALLYLRAQDHPKAAAEAARARSTAERLGKPAARLQCEALLLEGDLANRRARENYPPEGYFRRIFDVARRYDYPEDVWPLMESALSRLAHVSETERTAMMGPVPALRERQLKDKEEQRLMKARGSKKTPDMVRVSQGRIADADITVASMRAGFRRCFSTSGGIGGRAVLSISVSSGGRVENVDAKSENMAPQTLDCLKGEALRAQFNPPDTDHAILHVPVTFVEQDRGVEQE